MNVTSIYLLAPKWGKEERKQEIEFMHTHGSTATMTDNTEKINWPKTLADF